MELEGMTGRFFRICEIISRLAYANLLWIGFTLLGLGIFGFMPATVALFTVTRKWTMGEHDIPIFGTFWSTYKKEFFKSTLFGALLFFIGYIIYIDLTFLPTGGLFSVLRTGIFICGILYVIMLLYILPIYVHYNWKISQYLKYALLIGVSHPHYTALMGVGAYSLYYLCIKFPGIIPFFSMSLLAYVMMWTVYKVIRKLEIAQQVRESQEQQEHRDQKMAEVL
ncbi:YesL family protein [Sporosarcina ureilytica]|uniref:DUF624 domain-containing protein n=1 Tax=Sporosarcina ureilytica TaxID=298596 RepID=A0A1D8JIS7_9BACL|nr:YesL family protein [Sporosarcina ureilytica]AOV08605.1 hypothetical protein BI350_14390 [Sporosarcina ureilytica]